MMRPRWGSFLLCCTACALLHVPLVHAAAPELPDVARLWRDIRYTHPALADSSERWEQALARHLPAMAAAQDDATLRASLKPMLESLGDASLRILTTPDDALVDQPADGDLLEWVSPGTALLHLHAGRAVSDAQWQAVMGKLRSVRRLIVDTRAVSRQQVDLAPRLYQLAAACIASPLLLPAEQYRFSAAARPFDGWASPGMHAGLLTLETLRILPVAGARRIPMVLLVDAQMPVSKLALALQHQGVARILAQEGSVRSYAEPVALRRIGNATWVAFASGRLQFSDGAASYRPDSVMAPDTRTGAGSPAVITAEHVLARPWRQSRGHGAQVLLPVAAVTEDYGQSQLPEAGWRMLAAVKLWAVIDRQHPARYLLGPAWDDALEEALDKTLQAGTELEYGLALQALASQAGDSHVNIWSRALNIHRGKATPGIGLTEVDHRVVVASLHGAGSDAQALLAPGDEVVAVDGKRVSERLAEIRREMASSTEAGARRDALRRLLRGPEDRPVLLTVVSPLGEHEVSLLRRRHDEDPPQRPATRAVRRLDGNYAYVDLDLLEREEVPAMFDEIDGTDGVIFDLRGYPRATAWDIAPRLNVKSALYGPVIQAPFVSGHAGYAPQKLVYAEPLRPARAPLYRGKVVVLIDDRTVSQAEHTVLMFEAAAPVTLIGSPSSGTNGDLRHILLPGKVTVSYSGYEIAHVDGTRLQRIGLQPHIAVTPTLAGIRSGRDEILERAVQYLREGR